MICSLLLQTMPPWPSLHCNRLSYQLHLIAVISLAFQATSALNSRETCPDHFWLDTKQDACIDCTVCDKQSVIVLRPCQPHKDTVCGTFEDLESNWSWLAQTESSITAKWREVILLIDFISYFVVGTLFDCYVSDRFL